MSVLDLRALTPFVVTGATAVAILLAVAVRRAPRTVAAIGAGGIALAFVSVPFAAVAAPRTIGPLMSIDAFALSFAALFLLVTFAVALLAQGVLSGRVDHLEEFHALLVLSTLGAMTMAASRHFVSLFLGLELLSVGLYGLIAYPRSERRPLEAGIKYLVLAGTSSAVLLFGIAMLYTVTGSLEPSELASVLGSTTPASVPLIAGFGLVLAGAAFKLALVPFHLWTPDVYQGAPAPTTAYLATVSKGAMFALLLRYVAIVPAIRDTPVFAGLAAIAALSMLVGNLLALFQDDVRRLLAYSSIAHLGYLTIALLAGGALASTAAAFYLVAYMAATVGAFGVVGALRGPDGDASSVEDLRGLFRTRPWLAVILATCLLSLAGMPLTAGFVGKFYILAAGIGSSLWGLALTLAVGSVLGLYYYLRVVLVMVDVPRTASAIEAQPVPVAAGVVLAVLLATQVWIGVWPAPVQRAAERAVASLSSIAGATPSYALGPRSRHGVLPQGDRALEAREPD